MQRNKNNDASFLQVKKALRQGAHPWTLIGCFLVILVAIGIALLYLWLVDEASSVGFIRALYFTFFVSTGLLVIRNIVGVISVGTRYYGTGFFYGLPEMWNLSNKKFLLGTDLRRPPFPVSVASGVLLLMIGVFTLQTDLGWKYYLGIPACIWGSSYILTVVFMFGQTPVVLVLAASSDASVELQISLQTKLSKKIGNHGSVVSLLNLRKHGKTGVGIENLGGAQRTYTEDWRSVVRALAKKVRVIAVDFREASALLEEEIEWVLKSELGNKCIFLLNEEKDFPGKLSQFVDQVTLVHDAPSLVLNVGEVL